MNIIDYFVITIGLYYVIGVGIFRIRINSKRVERMIGLIGEVKTRLFYIIIGIVLIAFVFLEII